MRREQERNCKQKRNFRRKMLRMRGGERLSNQLRSVRRL